ncbi:hypothetical protein TREMEDRAFT_65685 [Tremella mesenterica DSM 1558]|uniref:uncharacterized protein n=1 Tax=Tremella mesenterica (strain ATCC 24925 / CBS 8224 / DSM 1558 / NBRC 9311 / NRRL Y-6157 / RJB 2259-6 / UBC 559-6) TaxID=578456 RepID=UPI00032D205F|nr:uncharacterized protein TREMEDRAFT_65685 [Tremella mesenterica DSM 1558]EIW66398.1 hypothetical protein TREMEDRAFT_65685 [Tremella mesenterica DSM 1558]
MTPRSLAHQLVLNASVKRTPGRPARKYKDQSPGTPTKVSKRQLSQDVSLGRGKPLEKRDNIKDLFTAQDTCDVLDAFEDFPFHGSEAHQLEQKQLKKQQAIDNDYIDNGGDILEQFQDFEFTFDRLDMEADVEEEKEQDRLLEKAKDEEQEEQGVATGACYANNTANQGYVTSMSTLSHPPSTQKVNYTSIREQALRNRAIIEIESTQIPISIQEQQPSTFNTVRTKASLGPGITAVKNFCVLSANDIGQDERYEEIEVAFHLIPKAFDMMTQDYLLRSQRVSDHIKVEWLDPPGLHPSDIRGRHAVFHVSDEAFAKGPDKLVWRSRFNCSGSCQQVQALPTSLPAPQRPKRNLRKRQRKEERSEGHEGSEESEARNRNEGIEGDEWAEEDQGSLQGKEDPVETKRTTIRKRKCPLCVEVRMTPRSIRRGYCTIIQPLPSYHGDPKPLSLLRISYHMRNILHDAATLVGTTESRLKLRWFTSISKLHPYATWLSDNCPHRMPKESDFATAIRTALRQDRLDTLPLAAIQVLHSANPSTFLSCEIPHDLVLGGTEEFPTNATFQCVISPKHALQTAIRHAHERGLAMDSSWRNKNAIRCPVTFLTTVNEHNHMVPMAEAKALVNGTSEVISEFEDKEIVLSNAILITEDGFWPLMVMIDCDAAERNAAQTVFPGTPVGREKTSRFLSALRKCQRCDVEEEWEEVYEEFEADVLELLDGDEEHWETIRTWLNTQWFSESWRKCIMDYGLPREHTRDGPLSTNNFVEAAFRTFDRVFLQARANKRIDKLLAVIVNIYFPMYLYSPPTSGRCDPDITQEIQKGLEIWQLGQLKHCDSEEIPSSLEPLKETFTIESGLRKRNAHYCGIKKSSDREYCSCGWFQSRGKRCRGLWALHCLTTCGELEAYEGQTAAYATALRMGPREGVGNKGTTSAQVDQEELRKWWGHDPTELADQQWDTTSRPSGCLLVSIDSKDLDAETPANEQEINPPIGRRHKAMRSESEEGCETPKKSESQPTQPNKGGRPASNKPLHPHRSQKKNKSNIQFRTEQLPFHERPVGAKNYNQTCSAISLFHIILRIPSFSAAFNAIKAELRVEVSRLVVMLENFFDCINVTRRIVDIPQMLQILRDESLVDQFEQHDPVELFLYIANKIRDNVTNDPVEATYVFDVDWQYVFAPCGHRLPVAKGDSTHERSMTIVPIHPSAVLGSSSHQTSVVDLIQRSLTRTCTSRHCLDCGRVCVTRSKAQMTLDTNSKTSIFIINVVWNLGPQSNVNSVTPFVLSPTLSASQISAFPSTTPGNSNIHFSLKGVLCRKGAIVTADSGHYVSLIQENGVWWELDDDRTSRLDLLSSAFQQTRFPVMLFYQRQSSGVTTPHPPRIEKINTASSHKPPELPLKLLSCCRLAGDTQEIWERMNKVPWRTQQSAKPVISAKPYCEVVRLSPETISSMSKELSQAKPKQASVNGKTKVDSQAKLSLFGDESAISSVVLSQTLGSEQAWYSNFMIYDILQLLSKLKLQKRSKGIMKDDVNLYQMFTFLHLDPGKEWTGQRTGGIPWSCLGRTGEWRKRVLVGVVSLAPDTHFGAMVIFGPQKLVLMFDGAGGAYNSPAFTKQWPVLLDERLSWEVQNGLATVQEVSGWEVLQALGWAVQVDSHSCGPLAAAAAGLLLQGIPPTAAVLGLNSPQLTQAESINLRTCILQVILAAASQDAVNQDLISIKIWKELSPHLPSLQELLDRL